MLATKTCKVYDELTDTFVSVGAAHQSKTNTVTMRVKDGDNQQSMTISVEVFKKLVECAYECCLSNGIDVGR